MKKENEPRIKREKSYGWLMQRLNTRLRAALVGELQETGLSLSQFAVMMHVLDRTGQTQSQIGQHFAMPAYAISRAIDGLEEMGLVERKQGASRRAHQIAATQAGEALAPRLYSIVREVNGQELAALTEDEAATFLALLSKVHGGVP